MSHGASRLVALATVVFFCFGFFVPPSDGTTIPNFKNLTHRGFESIEHETLTPWKKNAAAGSWHQETRWRALVKVKEVTRKKWSGVSLMSILKDQCISASPPLPSPPPPSAAPLEWSTKQILWKSETHPGFRTRRGNLRNINSNRVTECTGQEKRTTTPPFLFYRHVNGGVTQFVIRGGAEETSLACCFTKCCCNTNAKS